MKSIYKYIIEPKGERYKNTSKIGGKDFIINTDVENHQHISREGVVLSTPSAFSTPIKKGMDVIIHHNVFRRWFNMRAKEVNSGSFIEEGKYGCTHDQIFMYKEDGEWKGFDEFCFVSPVVNDDKFEIRNDKNQVGILEVTNKVLESFGLKKGDVIGFTPSSEYEFVVDGKLMYKMSWKDVCVKYDDGLYKPYQPDMAEVY